MRRVVKLGGSLTDATLRDGGQLVRWLASQSPAETILITGGGQWADAIRELHELGRISDTKAHWLAIHAMRLTAFLQFACHANWPFGVSWEKLLLANRSESAAINVRPLASSELTVCVPDPLEFMQAIEPFATGRSLPVGWHVTSDSIAARIAEVLGAEELVLLKACPPPTTHSTQPDFGAWAAAGYVDEWFPQVAPNIRHVRAVALA